MAERSREEPAEADQEATLYLPADRGRQEPNALYAPPSSERTVMYVAPAVAPPAQSVAPPAAQSVAPPPSPYVPAPPPHRGPMGSAPHVHPGSQPPPPYVMATPAGGPPPQAGYPDPRRMAQVPPTGGAAFRPAALPNIGPPTVLLQGVPDPRLVLIKEPESARAVSFRLLRDTLLAKRLPRVLAVSSAGKKDGKTTCALNLALSLSEGAKVLLLDGNLLEPELAKIFCIPDATPVWPPNVPWLGPYRIVEFARGLHVGGVVLHPGQPAWRFEKQWFEQLIGSLRHFPYDFIIIDAAALSESPTVSQLVGTADATLLAVRSGVTTARALRRATDQIPEGRGIGLALVDATIRR